MRATLITTGSVLFTTAVIGNAFYHKKQFYPSVVYITKSNPSMAVIYIQCLVIFLLIGKLMRQIFFGTLRAAELEHLIERAWYAVTETCLAFTVFRDDLNARFVGVFAILLFLKCFHWLAEDRVDFMERSPNINILFHVRIVSLLTVLAAFDTAFIYFAYHSIITKGAGTQLVFGFEYAILLATILNIVMKYILHWIDIASDSPWDEKAVCLLYTELVMSILKVTLYLVFVFAMLKYHNFPLFALRPIYLSLRTLKKALCDVIMSRRAIRNMNTLYPNATQEELANTDNVCIICREEMTGNGASKKLPCNHIFHVSCLRSWFQRQQTCPTCRMDILRVSASNTQQHNMANRNQNHQGAGGRGAQGQVPLQAAAGAAGGPQAPASVAGGAQQQAGAGVTTVQAQVILQDQMAAVMVQTFAQMFVEAMLTHLQTLNAAQLAQQQAPPPPPPPSAGPQYSQQAPPPPPSSAGPQYSQQADPQPTSQAQSSTSASVSSQTTPQGGASTQPRSSSSASTSTTLGEQQPQSPPVRQTRDVYTQTEEDPLGTD